MLFEADALWHQIIEEPKRGEVSPWITEIFDACGWGNWLRGPHGGCPNGYTRPPDPDWCGLFVAYCGLQAGLDPKLVKSVLPSTYRLHNPKTWSRAGYAKPERPEELAPGDVVVVGNAKPWGTHIVLVAEVGEDSFVTFEGNARGLLRDGTTGKGVVKRTRNLSEAVHVYRIPDECFR